MTEATNTPPVSPITDDMALLLWLHAEAVWHREQLSDQVLRLHEQAGEMAEEIERANTSWRSIVEQWERGHDENVLPYTTQLETEIDRLRGLLRAPSTTESIADDMVERATIAVANVADEFRERGEASARGYAVAALSAALAGCTTPPEPSRSTVTADEVTFHGCDNSNPDLCNCESWEPPKCDACDEELTPGDEVFFTQLQGLPWLPAGHRDQEHANWLWHVKCDQRAGGSQVGDQHGHH